MSAKRVRNEGEDGTGPLARAVDAVIDRFDLEGRLEGEALRRELAAVIDGILAARDGDTPSPPGARTTDHVRLLRALRPALLEEWTDEDEGLLELLRAFEAYERELLRWGTQVTVRDLLTPFSRKLLREVAHALRSPLGSIVALAGSLREMSSGSLGETEAHQLGIIHRAALTAATMASDLLAVTEDDDTLAQPVRFSTGELLATVSDLVRPVTTTRSSELQVAHADGPPREGPAGAITQALLTLALRAALMTREGTVRLRAGYEGDEAVFEVLTDGVETSSEAEALDHLRVLRMSTEGDSFTISSDGLAIEAARAAVARAGSELRLGPTPEGHLRMAFRVKAPAAP